MTQLMLSLLLLTVVGFSMVGIHDSFAADYSVEDDDCGASGGFPGSWNDDNEVCELDNDFVLTSDDELEITEVTLVIPNSISLENSGSIFMDEAGLTVDGTLNNLAEMEFATVEFNISGDLINSGTIAMSDSSFEVSATGTIENLADGIINNQDTPIGISGELNNYGELQNFGGYNIGLNGKLTNFGTINTDDDREFTISGFLHNTESGNFIQSQGIFTNKGLVENYASDSSGGQFHLSSGNPFITTKVNVEGTLRILQNSEFLNEAEIKLKNPGRIEIFGTLQNDGILQNGQIISPAALCGKIIGNTVSGTPPVDKCPIKSITISSPATNSKHGNVVPVTFTGTAIDVNAYGNEVPVTSSIIWTKTPLPQLTNQNGGSVSNQITTIGANTIRATVTDSGGNTKFTTITINIFNDVDGDGYLSAPNGNDCNDNNATINPGATEVFGDAIDNNCDGVVDNGFTDGDSDGYVEETLNVLPGFTDCDDNNAAINPGATEVFDDIDNNCDGVVDEGFTDFDMDGYATTTAGPQAIDCDDNNAAINPGATEVFDDIDNNCDGVVDEGFTDFDMDGYATTTAGPQAIDCDDNNAAINPGATEVFGDAIDNNCDGSIDNGFTDGDSDGYVEETLNVLSGFTDCDDNNAAINPGATEVFGDAIDNNCDGSIDNGFTDGDSDGYVEETLNVLSGFTDCDDNNAAINPGATEIGGNGIDDNCDGTIDDGVDEDGDGWVTGPGLGFDCHDRIQTDPESIYFGIDPAEINPDAAEIIGDNVDNNCDDTTDEIVLITFGDSYVSDGDSVLSIPAIGILENDIIPFYTETVPVVYPVSALLPVDVNLETQSTKGNAALNSDGSFTYSPTDPLFGSDSFEYSISYLNSDNELIQSDISTVNLTQKFCGKDISEFDNVIVGTDSKDNLNGSNDDDLILGLGGNDKINGKKGNDCIYGGDGNDNINGHDGNDEIHGGDGNDKIRGHAGDDKLFGDNGDDNITGNNGMDEIHGGDGNDKIVGNQDDDKLFGDNGDDNITGNNGMDEIHGGDGNDKIVGNQDDDKLFGDNGDDRITGNNGDDVIDGGNDYDYCKGNNGVNTIVNCEDDDRKDDKHDDKDDRKDDKHDDKDDRKDDKHDDKDDRKDDNKGKGRK